MKNPASAVTATLLSLSFCLLSSAASAQDDYSAEIMSQCTDQAQGLEPQDASTYIDSCVADANANLGLNQYSYEEDYPDESEIEAEDEAAMEEPGLSEEDPEIEIPAE